MLALEMVHRVSHRPILNPNILSLDARDGLAEYDLRDIHHLPGECVFGAFRLGDHLLPILDEPLRHPSAEENCVARVRELVDEREELRVHLPSHPIQLTLRTGYKA